MVRLSGSRQQIRYLQSIIPIVDSIFISQGWRAFAAGLPEPEGPILGTRRIFGLVNMLVVFVIAYHEGGSIRNVDCIVVRKSSEVGIEVGLMSPILRGHEDD